MGLFRCETASDEAAWPTQARRSTATANAYVRSDRFHFRPFLDVSAPSETQRLLLPLCLSSIRGHVQGRSLQSAFSFRYGCSIREMGVDPRMHPSPLGVSRPLPDINFARKLQTGLIITVRKFALPDVSAG